jgi:hypothetical protein
MSSREAVMTALLTQLQTVSAFKLASRRNRDPATIGPALSPALFLLEHAERYVRSSVAMPPTREMMVSVIFYNDVGADANAVPATIINTALDALDAALKPNDPSNLFTLGGLVDSVVVDDTRDIERAPGDKTGKALAVVPLRIVLP